MERSLLATALMVGSLGAGCGGEIGLVQEISSVEVALDQGACPAEATALIRAGIGACERVLSPEVERRGDEVRVRIWTAQEADTCISVLLSHDEIVPLGRFEPGAYEVVVEARLGERRRSFQVDPACD